MQVAVPGRIALVTGGAQGIGRAIALELARSGAEGVCIVDRQPEAGRAACAQLQAAGVPAEFAPVDLEHDDAVDAAMAACLGRFGRIDCLVNAAGLTDRGSLAEATPQLWEMLFRVNARAPALLMQRCIADLRSRGAAGSIVNILSINVHCGARDLAVYSASKAALALLTKNAAQAHRFDRIRVNGINVGWAATPGEMRMQAETLGKGPQWLEQANATRPFGRLLSADDVARLAMFMLSDASLPMTGTLVDLEQSVNGAVD
jgi:NAD(P)-dependent dehydrogenase (short-subunit alcohol dehydrogenase family)